MARWSSLGLLAGALACGTAPRGEVLGGVEAREDATILDLSVDRDDLVLSWTAAAGADGFSGVERVSASGEVLSSVGGPPGFADGPAETAQFNRPKGVARLGDDLIVADGLNHRVRRIDSDLNVTTFAGNGDSGLGDGSPLEATFFLPQALAVDDSGDIWVADGLSVRRITDEVSLQWFEAGADASDLAFNELFDGVLLLEGSNFPRVLALDPAREWTTLANMKGGCIDGPAPSARFGAFVIGFDVAADGSIYVPDADNGRIRRIGPDGQVVTIAGDPAERIEGDECPRIPIEGIQLGRPTSLALSRDGRTLFVVDSCADGAQDRSCINQRVVVISF
ncbi:MAG: hypothetical protein Q8O67_30930 [Deltaproteobacteria bacterium]|nr:hypothetical protein [Deltaproteobacteria bacterium]